MSIGGRFNFDDDGQTPNTQIAVLDYEPAPLICEVRGLPAKPGDETMDTFRSLPMGIIVQCEGGAYISSRRTSAVYDSGGKQVTTFVDRRPPEEQGPAHQVNFVRAMRSRRAEDLNAEVLDGHLSAALGHMANVSYRLADPRERVTRAGDLPGHAVFLDAIGRMQSHLETNGVDLDKTPALQGPWVMMDPSTERFHGEHAERANALSRRDYRSPFVVQEIV
jgi:hypothetical protein